MIRYLSLSGQSQKLRGVLKRQQQAANIAANFSVRHSTFYEFETSTFGRITP